MPSKKSSPADFSSVFTALKKILAAHAASCVVASDTRDHYLLNSTKPHPMNGQAMMVAAVRTGKNYVSFHLMPVYGHPPLLEKISPELKKRMQGKACFNFVEVNAPLFDELANLTQRGIVAFTKAGYM
jgi:hypothetical protein